MPVEDQADPHSGAHGACQRYSAGRLLEVKAQRIADIEAHEVRIYRGIYNVQPPEKQEEEQGIVLVFPELVPVAAQGVVVAVGQEDLQLWVYQFQRVTRRVGLSLARVDIQQRDGLLTFLITGLIVKIGIGRHAYSRPDDEHFPVFPVIDLPQAGKEGRIQGGMAWIVEFAGRGIGLIRIVLGLRFTDGRNSVVLGRTRGVQEEERNEE